MALRKIMTEKEPVLHKKCRPVTEFNSRLHQLLDDMRDTLEEANGAGLAAPQVGILRRVVVVDTGEEMLELVNPEILEQSGEQDGPEGCRQTDNSAVSVALSEERQNAAPQQATHGDADLVRVSIVLEEARK